MTVSIIFGWHFYLHAHIVTIMLLASLHICHAVHIHLVILLNCIILNSFFHAKMFLDYLNAVCIMCVVLADDGRQTRCRAFRGGDTISRDAILVNRDALAGNTIQFFVECAQPNDTIIFALPIVNVSSTIVIDKPLSLRGADGSEVQFGCQAGGTVFDIQ